MTYIGVGELKQSKRVWKMLAQEKELVVTRDGRPGALLVEVAAENVEESLKAIRRAMFSVAVSAGRRRAGAARANVAAEVAREISASRRARAK